jgi:hypothetical protein
MTRRFLLAFIGTALMACPGVYAGEANSDDNADMTEQMKDSMVFLSVTSHSYDQFQPWKRTDISDRFAFGCAVGPYQILTTAWNITDAVHVKARRHGQNEFIPATIRVIDYETNLCLLDLDKNAVNRPLKPISFTERYTQGLPVKSYWLSSGGHLTTARGFLDRAEVNKSTVSFARLLSFVVSNANNSTGRGAANAIGTDMIGISFFSDDASKEVGLIPAETINRFLAEAQKSDYKGFGTVGFSTRSLIDPAMRKYLKVPAKIKHGVYVSKVFNLGTGSDTLEEGDVIVAIDEHTLNPYGRYEHPDFDRIALHHLINSRRVGEKMKFSVYRQGKKKSLTVTVKGFKAVDMLIPYYEFTTQPEYIVTGGLVIQKLTRNYFGLWGEGWTGKVPPHLYRYYRDAAFMPTDQRSNVVILSHILPADINLGYQGLGSMVVSKFNGMDITCIADILKAQKLKPESKFHTIEFEHDYPTVVIPRQHLAEVDELIARNYGIEKLVNIN